jgi:hypothetical protein
MNKRIDEYIYIYIYICGKYIGTHLHRNKKNAQFHMYAFEGEI